MKVGEGLIFLGVLLVIAGSQHAADSKPAKVEYRYLPRDLDMQMKDAEKVGALVGEIFTEDSPFFQGRPQYAPANPSMPATPLAP
jgi:hypothetical protein